MASIKIGVNGFTDVVAPKHDGQIDSWFFTEQGFDLWQTRFPEAKALIQAITEGQENLSRQQKFQTVLSLEIVQLINALPEREPASAFDGDSARAKWLKDMTKLAVEQYEQPQIVCTFGGKDVDLDENEDEEGENML